MAFLAPILGAVGSAAASAVGAVGSAASAVGSAIAGAASSILSGIGGAAGSLMGGGGAAAAGAGEAAAAGAGSSLAAAAPAVAGSVAPAVGGAIGPAASSALAGMAPAASSIAPAVGGAITPAAASGLAAIPELGIGAAQPIGSLASLAPTVGALETAPISGTGLLAQAPAVGMASGGAGGLTPGGIAPLLGAKGAGGGVTGGAAAEGLNIGGPVANGASPMASTPAANNGFKDIAKKMLENQMSKKNEENKTAPMAPPPNPVVGGNDIGWPQMMSFKDKGNLGMVIAEMLRAQRGF